MKIIHTEASCGWGGQEIRILNESCGLIKRGHNISILCPKNSQIFSEAARYHVPTIDLPIDKKNLRSLFILWKWLKKNPVDIVNTHSSTDTWLTALACKMLSSPPSIIRTRHISAQIPNHITSRWLYTAAVNHIVTTGKSLRKQVIQQTGASPDHVTSVPTGINEGLFKPNKRNEAKASLGLDANIQYIGILATLRSWKGHLYLLEAFSQLKEANWKLLIVGDGPMREQIAARIDQLALNNKVTLVGHQNSPELWLQAMDLFCLPSYANEGVPQAILQAMLTELPIITTNAGAISEAIKHERTGIICNQKDPDDLSVAIKMLINNPEFARQLGKNARQFAKERFSYKHLLDSMEKIFISNLPTHSNTSR